MTKMLFIGFTCSKDELTDVLMYLDPLDPSRGEWARSEYVEQLLEFLKKSLAEYKEEEKEEESA